MTAGRVASGAVTPNGDGSWTATIPMVRSATGATPDDAVGALRHALGPGWNVTAAGPGFGRWGFSAWQEGA